MKMTFWKKTSAGIQMTNSLWITIFFTIDATFNLINMEGEFPEY